MGSGKEKVFDPSKLHHIHSFVTVNNNSLEDDDLPEGTELYIANMQAMPFTEDDLYLQRLYAMCHIHLGKGEVDTSGVLIVDPRNLDKIPVIKHDKIMKKFKKRYEN